MSPIVTVATREDEDRFTVRDCELEITTNTG